MTRRSSQPSRRRRNRTRGQALVEFALVVPVFLLILSGVLDFGFMLFNRITVINAAREGARIGVIAEDATTIPAVATSAAQGVATAINGALNVSTTCVRTSGTCTFTNSGGSAIAPGDAINVVTSYTYHSFFPLLFGSTFNLTANVQMVRE